MFHSELLQTALLKHTSYWLPVEVDCSYLRKGEHYKSYLQCTIPSMNILFLIVFRAELLHFYKAFYIDGKGKEYPVLKTILPPERAFSNSPQVEIIQLCQDEDHLQHNSNRHI